MRITLADLKTRGLRMADTPAASTTRTDARFSDDDLTELANDLLGELHELMVGSYESYFRARAEVPVTSGQDWTRIPSDLWKVRKLFLIDSGRRVELFPFDLNELEGTTRTDTGNRPGYQLEGAGIRWSQPWSSNFTLEVWYVRGFRPLLEDSTEVDPEVPETFVRYVVAGIAAEVLGIQERDPSYPLSVMARKRETIQSLSHNRDQGHPTKVRDVNLRFSRFERPRLPTPRI